MIHSYDVAVVGGGYTGNLAAMVLRRKGYTVAVLEGAAFPRFAIGESTTPEQNRMHVHLSRRYGVPELFALSSYLRIKAHRLPLPTWPKESFYFLMNHGTPGTDCGRPQELVHQSTPWPIGPDYHMLRSDFDVYFCALAQRYGAHIWGVTNVKELDLSPGNVTVVAEDGEGVHEIRARLLVDTTGHSAFLGNRLGLVVKDPPHVTLRSRAIFNHFLGVRGLEESYAREWPDVGLPRDHATVHHLWPEAWSWVIPFDNGITSVGIVLNMDRDQLDHRALSPAEAFHEMGRRNPAFASMMREARPVRPWVRTERLQWQVSTCVGDSWVILPPASGFTDPLLSPGMASAVVSVGRLAEAVDPILRDGTSPKQALAQLEAAFQVEMEYTPRLLHSLFLGFHHYDIFRETFSIFRMGTFLNGLNIIDGGSREVAHSFLEPLWGFAYPEIRALVDATHATLSRGLADGRSDEALADEVRDLVEAHDRHGFLRSGVNRPRRTGVYLFYFPAMLRWAHRLSSESGKSAWIWHILRMALRTSFQPRINPGRWAPPLPAKLLALALRHLRITFDPAVRWRRNGGGADAPPAVPTRERSGGYGA
jgi:FADH2 O2-dependent halogenase